MIPTALLVQSQRFHLSPTGSHGRSSWWVWPPAEVDTSSLRIPVLFYYHHLDGYVSVSSPTLCFRMWLRGFVSYLWGMIVNIAKWNNGFHSMAMLDTAFPLPNIRRVLNGVVGTLAGTAPCILHFRRTLFCFHGATSLVGQGLLIIEASRSHSDTTHGRTPLDDWSARRRYLYLTTENTSDIHAPRWDTNPQSQASERPQTHALDREATGICSKNVIMSHITNIHKLVESANG